MNLGQLLTNAARRRPDAPAVSQGDRTLTYAELDARVDALAHALTERGVRPGDRVATLMPNSPELLESMFACFKAGFTWVPLNARFQSDEVDFHLTDSGSSALMTSAEFSSVVEATNAAASGLVVATGPDRSAGAFAYEDFLDGGRGHATVNADVDRDTLAWLFYTSGTTGRPKGAMLSHGVLGFVTASWLADLTPMGDDAVTLHAAPLTHGAGFHALAAVARGAHQVLAAPGRFEPAAILALMATARVTNTWLVPTQIIMLADHLGSGPVDLPDLTHIVYGGAPFPEPELRRALAAFGPRLVQLYGQGETPMTATVLSTADHALALAEPQPSRLSSAGYPRPGMEVRIVDAEDREVPTGEVGEVAVRGPAVMLGYWQRADATAEALRRGWLHTGDLGRADATGCVFLLDRKKDMIITGGSNVYAVEIEAVLLAHQSVSDVAVVGVPDRTWGERVVAVVVACDGATDGLETALRSLCEARLAAYKHPRSYCFVGSLPRNSYGKVVKRELREQLVAGR